MVRLSATWSIYKLNHFLFFNIPSNLITWKNNTSKSHWIVSLTLYSNSHDEEPYQLTNLGI